MTQAPGALPTPTVLDYERTLILAIELSNTSWVLAAQIPGLPGVKAERSIEPTPEALMAAIEDYRTRAVKAGQNVMGAQHRCACSGHKLVRTAGAVLRRREKFTVSELAGGPYVDAQAAEEILFDPKKARHQRPEVLCCRSADLGI
jgi:hypothetical protein